MRTALLLLAGLALVACERGATDSRGGPAQPSSLRAFEPATGDAEAEPFDASDMVFEPADPIEPPEVVVQIPPRPPPPPPPLPIPELISPPLPTPRGQAGRCDVRETEGYCFAYTGDAWTPSDARTQCVAAPSARFAEAACPLADRIATCTFERASAPDKEIVYTYYAPYDPALAELACPGTFARVD